MNLTSTVNKLTNKLVWILITKHNFFLHIWRNILLQVLISLVFSDPYPEPEPEPSAPARFSLEEEPTVYPANPLVNIRTKRGFGKKKKNYQRRPRISGQYIQPGPTYYSVPSYGRSTYFSRPSFGSYYNSPRYYSRNSYYPQASY